MATTMERFQKESIDYIINALLSSSELIENCAICSYKDRTMIKKAIDYAERIKIMDTYKTVHGISHIDMTIEQYKSDLKESFTDGLDTALSFSVGGVQTTTEEAFEKFYSDHKFRRKI